MRNDPQWTSIFNSIPAVVPSGTESKTLIFSQRAFIADAVYQAQRHDIEEIKRLRAWITAIGDLADVEADHRGRMARDALRGDLAP